MAIEECFGTVWLEILNEVRLSEDDEIELYREMIQWAKQLMEMRMEEASRTTPCFVSSDHFTGFSANSANYRIR